MYVEYAVKASPTQKEKMIRIILYILAAGFFILSLFFWPMVIGGFISVGLIFWYQPRMNYEYEYILFPGELTIDKVIAKSDRKKKAVLDLANLELFTNDPAQIRYYSQDNKADVFRYQGDPDQGEPCWLLMRTTGKPNLFEITGSPELLKEMRRAYPQKTKLQIK